MRYFHQSHYCCRALHLARLFCLRLAANVSIYECNRPLSHYLATQVNTVKNILSAIAIVLTVIVLVSSIIYMAPVDPARMTFGQRADQETVALKRAELHLDEPVYVQIWYYIKDLSPIATGSSSFYKSKGVAVCRLTGDEDSGWLLKSPYLRESFQSGRPVLQLLVEAVPKTIILAVCAILIAFLLGCVSGTVAAIYRDTWLDRSIISLTVLGISVPSYVSAMILALVFGYLLRDYTGLNIQGSIFDLDDMGNERIYLRNLILPAIALGVRPLSIITQLMRSSLLDVISMDYLRTAQSKGLTFLQAVRKHAITNALNPVLTAATGWFASLLAGAFFVEQVFNFKGVGELTVNALINYDIPLILGCTIFICSIFIVINMGMDALYRFVDPKLRSN